MKKIPILFAIILLLGITLSAQAQQFINYQGVARNNAGEILVTQAVGLRLSILSGSATGAPVYVETHARTTDAFGLFTLQIGQGTVVSGQFDTINWGAYALYLKVEIDPTGGTNYAFAGTSQFASVPYSFHAANGLSNGNTIGDILFWNGTNWLPVPVGINGQALVLNNGVPTWGGIESPLITTTPISNTTITSAVSGGNVISSGSDVTARGVCWGTSANPTIDTSKTTNGTGLGTFNSALTGLTPNTNYHARAYATNSVGTGYGLDIAFNTQNGIAVLSTAAITNITNLSATSGGNITADGGAPITARGICYNTSPNPTTANSTIQSGTGTGLFTANLNSLAQNTTYFVRAYATNSVGTYYGGELSFQTVALLCGLPSVTVNHSVGNGVAPVNKSVTYNVVTNISGEPTKCWITSNLGATNQATAVNDATEDAAGWYWQFNRKQGYKHDGTTRTPATAWISSIFENSNWVAANDPCFLELGSGWRLPTSTEYTNVDANGGWTIWTDPYASGLKLHAAGELYYSDGSLPNRGYIGSYCSSTQESTNTWSLYFHSSLSVISNRNKASGFTARCLRETMQSATLLVTTTSVSAISSTTAVSGGNITDDGSLITARGICYGTAPNPTTLNNIVSGGSGMGTYISQMTGLIPNTIYYVRAYAVNSAGTWYGNELNFNTLAWANSFTSATGTYSQITGGSVLGSGPIDDNSYNSNPIGFSFTYYGTAYTNFSVNANGFLAMGSTVNSNYAPISTLSGSNNVISALGRDLGGNAGASLSYLTTGAAPNRVLTVQWTDFMPYAASGCSYNFQIKLYETSNKIELVYGSFSNNATYYTAQVGLRGATNAYFFNRSTTSNWAASTSGATNAATMTLTSTVVPSNGLVYTWTPY